MNNTVIIIPSRLEAKRFPNKPLAKINGVPMIVHVMRRAEESQVGDVFIATPDQEIIDIVKKNGGQPILTKQNHLSGSDRIHEVYLKKLKDDVDLIINLQGDMPNIKPNSISELETLMRKYNCEIGTLASNMKNEEEIFNPNIVKVVVEEDLKKNITDSNNSEKNKYSFSLKLIKL